MLGIPSYIKVKEKYQEPVDFILFFVFVCIVLLSLYFLFLFLRSLNNNVKHETFYFYNEPHDGKEEKELTYKSFHDSIKEDYSFTVSGFIYIQDWKYRFNDNKTIVKLGEPSIHIYLDSKVNNLIVKVNDTEFIIKNVDIHRWFHFGLVIRDLQIELYYNGKVYSSHLLTQLPKKVNDEYKVCLDGGFDGLLYQLSFIQKALKYKDILKLSEKNPPIHQKYFKT